MSKSDDRTAMGKLQVKKIAGSLCIRITNMTKYLDLKDGDWVYCTIEKVEKKEVE